MELDTRNVKVIITSNSDDSSCDNVTKYNVDLSKNNHNVSVEGSHLVIQDVNRIPRKPKESSPSGNIEHEFKPYHPILSDGNDCTDTNSISGGKYFNK